MNAPKFDLHNPSATLGAYPEGVLAQAAEEKIAQSLPILEGLTTDLTQGARVAVFSNQARIQRATFIGLHGSPFGCEELAGVPFPAVVGEVLTTPA